MSLRHTPRQAERDVRLHDPHAHHSHSLPPPHAQLGHAPHMNGNGVPSTPGPLTGPSAHPQPQLVSPPVMPSAVPNGAAPSSSIQKLAQANEQTWLLIGGVYPRLRLVAIMLTDALIWPDHLCRSSRRADGKFGTRPIGVRERAATQPDVPFRFNPGRGHRPDQGELSEGESQIPSLALAPASLPRGPRHASLR